jgi:4-azaleucine resistance transporter AzlC
MVVSDPAPSILVESESVSGIRAGMRAGFPLAVAGLADGLIFGTLARQAGLSPAEATVMSALVGAGTAQFLAIGLWASPIPVATILLTTLGVNLRHLLMGVTMHPAFSTVPSRRLYPSLFFLSDESWAVSTHELTRGRIRETFLLGSGAVLAAGWVGATFAGATLGQAIDDPARWGLDFAFVAIFACLLASLWPGRERAVPWVVAGLTAVVAQEVLPTGWHILAGGLAGTVVGVIRHDA